MAPLLSSNEILPVEVEKSPQDFIVQGKRELVCGEISKAVDSFQKACELLAKLNGDLHESLAEPNLLYGSALLELARMESNVLGNALDGVPEQDNSSGDEEFFEKGEPMTDEVADQVIDAMCTKDATEESSEKEASCDNADDAAINIKSEEKKLVSEKEESTDNKVEENVEVTKTGAEKETEKAVVTEKETEKAVVAEKETEKAVVAEKETEKAVVAEKETEKAVVTEKEAEKAVATGKEVENAENGNEYSNKTEKDEEKDVNEDDDEENENEGEDEDGEEDDAAEVEDDAAESEDVGNLQLSWECIEVAKKIFSLNETKESQLKVADCFEKLAEISREKEDYDQALTDLKEALSIRFAQLGENDRLVAETHYQIGTTHAVAGGYDDALTAFNSCATCLKTLLNELETKKTLLQSKDEIETNAAALVSLTETCNELKELIPDIEKRIAEVEEDKVEEARLVAMKASTSGCQGGSLVGPSKDGEPVTDISHLVRKKNKRPAEDSTEVDSTPCDKVNNATEDQNGGPKVNGDLKDVPAAKKVKLAEDVTVASEETKISNGALSNGTTDVPTVAGF